MDMDETETKFYQIFFPEHLDALNSLVSRNQRFAYYTSAETAVKIIENKELWLRNATLMNDFSEIYYGLELIEKAFLGDAGKLFKCTVGSIFPQAIETVEKMVSSRENDWKLETYLSCISLHDPTEDVNGRLSMWRAYGDVAIVVNNAPLVAFTDSLGFYSAPVRYLTLGDFTNWIENVANAISENAEYLKNLGENTVLDYIYDMLFLASITTKHPGFKEEQEWRIYYQPREQESSILNKKLVVLNGTPQDIFSLPLEHRPKDGLFNADIPNLIDRIIVGPTEYPYVSVQAFIGLLESRGVSDAASKVVASEIPLRTM